MTWKDKEARGRDGDSGFDGRMGNWEGFANLESFWVDLKQSWSGNQWERGTSLGRGGSRLGRFLEQETAGNMAEADTEMRLVWKMVVTELGTALKCC